MLARPSAHYVCASCLVRLRQTRKLSSAQRNLPTLPPPSGAARLDNRRLISLHGPDASKFLQGIITNNVRSDSRAGFYAAFLTAQGKVINDVFVYPTNGSKSGREGLEADDPGFLVEADANEAESLFKHVKRHKLRAKLEIRLLDAEEMGVWAVWREQEKWTPHEATFGELSTAESNNLSGSPGILSLIDSRAPGMGRRILLPPTSSHASPVVAVPGYQGLETCPMSAYTLRRYLRGVPEGQTEIPRDSAFPLNSNIDVMGGIDFRKGCYIGQELTIRTHHTGVVRKRILPVALYESGKLAPERLEYDSETNVTLPVEDSDIVKEGKRGRAAGKWIAGIGNIGLAMCRLEMMTDLVVTAEGSSFDAADRFIIKNQSTAGDNGGDIGIKAFVPDWLKGKIKAPKVQKRVE
ncbi:mRNA-decapping enzyme subunit 2 [Elasticomyces elasticus]|nr:mRNA-decapping enzyme subunit 2 [Elasticomyces elasticus]